MADTPIPVAYDEIVADTPAEVHTASVVVKDSEGNETVFALDRPVITFGREESNDIVIDDKRCSRKHFVIEMAGDYFNAVDQGSTNKLRLKDRKLLKRRLRNGDEIIVGGYRILYKGPTDESHPDELLDAPPVSNPTFAPGPSSRGDTIPVPDQPVPESLEEASEEVPEGIIQMDLDEPEPIEEVSEDAEVLSDDEVAEAVEEVPPEPEITPAPPEPDPIDDAKICPQCETPMPENAPCETCGHKSLQLQAQEYFVNHTAKNTSILGGIGLWSLKKGKVLEKVFAMEGVDWVLKMVCERCGKKHRVINEFRVRFMSCEHCKSEIPLPAQSPPEV